jgi:hypothetical protein
MPWIYNQTTGAITHNGLPVGTGYSGFRNGRNNPNLENAEGLGPIPRGRYTIGPPHHSGAGEYVMNLIPVGHNAYGRTLLRIHGERREGPPGNASTGCIVLPRNVRERIFRSGDHVLEVVR